MKYEGKEKMNLKAKFMNLFRENVNISKKISVGLLSFMIMLSLLAPVVNANDFQPNPDTTKDAEVKANEAANSNPEMPKTIFDDEQVDGLEIGPEIIGQPVGAAVQAPTIDPVLYDATTISGKKLAKTKVNKQTVIATVHVTLKGEDGTVKATLSVTPTSGTTWKVDLPAGVKVAKGDTVTVYQQIGEDKSPEVTKTAQQAKADLNKDKLQMPTGEIWIEQTSSNIVNEDEQAEAVAMFNNANKAIAGDIKSVKFSIDTAEHAYYEVTYTDNTTSGKIEATNLQIKQVTETSRSPEISSITIVDNVVKGKLAGPGPFDGIKVKVIINVKKEKADNFCTDKGCKLDKDDSSTPVEATLKNDGSFSYNLQAWDSLTLDQIVGVSVKEPHKFVSCSTTTVKSVTVEKTEVKDPRKLTAEDKKAIDAAIRKAYIIDGVSKLPNGTGDWEGVPAVIQIDDSGNVKIFSGNDVAGDWDNDGNFVPEKNDDGSVKITEGAEPKITIPAKDLLKNIAPKSPAIKVDTDTGKVTITPPAYKDPGDDTDLLSYTITYKDNSGAEKTVTATRDLQTNKWSGTGVYADTGVITLSVEDVELAGTIKATAKDNGGLEGDTDKLDSKEKNQTLETATVSYDANKGTGKMDGKTLNKGSKYKILSNAFTAPANEKFKTWKIGETEYAAGDEITVKADTSIKAIWQKSYSISYNWGKDVPDTATLPTDSKNYYEGDSYTVDDKYTKGTTVEGEKDGKKGTWTFSGWTDPNNGTMGDKAVTITGSWTFTEAEKYKVSYDWGADAPAGKDLPKDTGSYYKEDKYTVDTTYKKGDTVEGEKDGKKGTWTFSGWTDPNNGTMGDKNATITGSWTFKEADNNSKPGTQGGNDNPDQPDKPGDNPNHPGSDKPGLTPGQNVPNDNDLVPGQSGAKGKGGTQSNGTSNLNSKNNRTPNTGDNGMNMLYAFGLALAACGVLVINRIYRKEK